MNHNWLDDVVNVRTNFESPKKFFYWSALAAISAIVKRNVFLRKKDAVTKRINYILYPNISVFLVGDSAVVRKGPPIKFARKLVRAVDKTRIISGRSSIQGILKDLATVYTREGRPIINDSSCFICASELRSSLVQDPQAISILTDLHDGDFADEWKVLLKGTGVEELKNVNITMLAGSNPAYLKATIAGPDVEGGIIGRSFLVYADTRQTINSLAGDIAGEDDADEGEDLQYSKEADWLRELSNLKGRFQFSKDAAKEYDTWYRDFTQRKISDRTGTIGRLHDQVLKVGMLISLAKRQTLILEKDDIVDAIDACMDLMGNVNRAIMPTGKSDMAEKTSIFLQELLNDKNSNGIERHKFLKKYWQDLDAFDLDRIIETLLEARAVSVKKDGKTVTYKITQSALEQYKLFKGES